MPRFNKNNKGLRANEPLERQKCRNRELARAKRGDDRSGEFFRAGFAAHVLRDVLALAVDFFEGTFDPASCGPFAKMVQHHDAAQ
jgi:hypothetical protein